MNTISLEDALRSRWTLEGKIPLAGVADGAVWHRARTVATEESVVLFIVQGETALEAADAVRRAYLVDDPHLLPVREIVVLDDPRDGESGDPSGDGPTTVVEYPVPTAPPLAALLGSTSLHPETARSIVGEAASGLEAARRRGVRHQFLDSNRLFVNTRSGEVVVLGVGVEAASHPGLDRSREVASFQDTASLVALLYRALTGKAPKHGPDGLVPLPSTLVDSAIPADLDLLCDLVLNESADDVPETTRELISALEPWQSIPVTLEAYPHAGAARHARTSGDGSSTADGGSTTAATGDAADTVVRPASGDTADTVVRPASGDTEDGDTEDTVVRPAPGADAGAGAQASSAQASPSSAGAAGVVGAAGAAGAAGAVAAHTGDTPAGAGDGTAKAPDRSDGRAEGAAAESTPSAGQPVEAQSVADQAADEDRAAAAAQDADRQAAEETARRSADAEAIVKELHLDQKRGSSPFPGHLDVAATAAPEHESTTASGSGSADQSASSDQEGTAVRPALGAGAAAAAGAGALASSTTSAARPTEAGSPPSTPSEPSAAGSPQPLAPADGAEGAAAAQQPSQRRDDPMQFAAEQTPQQAPDGLETDSAAAPSAATSPSAMPVPGRTEPVAPAATGPIVVRGRDRIGSDPEPEESAAPYARSSLLRDVVSVAVDSDDPGTYALGPRAPEERSRQSQWIIAGAVLLTIIAAVFAVTTATSGLRDRITDPLETKAAPTTPAPTESGEAPVEPTKEPTKEPELPAPEVSGVELSAEGGGDPDHTDQQDRLTDGDPATFWSTQHYASPDFGGIKEGVAIQVSFAEKSKVTALTVATARNTGGTLELRAVNEDGSLGDVLATGAFAGDGEVRLEPDKPVDAEKVALYISELPPDSNEAGRFRARIAEITAE